jgi:hypothetical protein
MMGEVALPENTHEKKELRKIVTGSAEKQCNSMAHD